jgi:uncharacterized membrane protein
MTHTHRSRPGAAGIRPPAGGPPPPGSSLGFERIVFFSDAVYAIVITLLVLPLTAEIELPEDEEGLAHQVLALWPSVLTFAVSFLVIGQFWIAHHRTFGYIRRHDHGLVWFNLVALMTVAFMPFPAALLGSHSTADDAFPVVFYAASLTLTSAALTATWLYAARRDLLDDSLGTRQTAGITHRAFATTAVFAVSVAAAFIGLTPAVGCWLVVLPAVRLLVGRWGTLPPDP